MIFAQSYPSQGLTSSSLISCSIYVKNIYFLRTFSRDGVAMKLITLNIWGGHVRDPLHQFISNHQNIDIFCFQEVYHDAKEMITIEDRKVSLNIFSELQILLPNHIGYFKPAVDGIYGISMFIKKQINVLAEGESVIHDNPTYSGRGPSHSRILQWAKCNSDGNLYTIMNVH